MKRQSPLVSVIMPVYNAGNFLIEALESIINQTYQNFKLIIVDDHSKDNSWEIIKQYKKQYPKKIKAFCMRRNLNRGGDACANFGIRQAKGKYIARMDADDIAHPERLQKQIAFLENHPQYFLIGSNAYIIDKEGKTIGEKLEPTTHEEIYKRYFTFHPIIHPSAMFKRMIAKKPFSYQIKYSLNNDYYTFFKLICRGAKFANLKEKLLFYRIHDSNNTFVRVKENFFNTLRVRIALWFNHDYVPTLSQIAITLAQTLLTLILPQFLVKKLYLFSKRNYNQPTYEVR